MAGIIWGPWQEKHIAKRKSITREDFREAWHDEHRQDLAQEGHEKHGPYYRRDPRTKEQRIADARALARFERGEFLKVAPSVERAAIRHVRRKYQERRRLVARLGRELGRFRRILGVSQEDVAKAIGTQKTNVSRVESGRYGGLTIERLVAMLEAMRSAAGRSAFEPLFPPARRPPSSPVHDPVLDRFTSPASCLES